MKIAVASRGHAVAPQLLQSDALDLYDANEDRTIASIQSLRTHDLSRDRLPEFLWQIGADVLIAGDVDDRERQELQRRGVRVVARTQGDAKAAAQKFLDGRLPGGVAPN